MWVKKTEEEIKNSKNKEEYIVGIRVTPLKGGIFIFFFIFILEVAFDMIIGKSKDRLYLPSDYVREKVTLSELPMFGVVSKLRRVRRKAPAFHVEYGVYFISSKSVVLQSVNIHPKPLKELKSGFRKDLPLIECDENKLSELIKQSQNLAIGDETNYKSL